MELSMYGSWRARFCEVLPECRGHPGPGHLVCLDRRALGHQACLDLRGLALLVLWHVPYSEPCFPVPSLQKRTCACFNLLFLWIM